MNLPTNAQDADAVNESGDFASDRILARIGQLTRTLRDSMRELGLDKHVERAAEAVPDARDRLKYIANMTEQAAERVLSAIDVAKPIQEQLQHDAGELDARWEQWYAAPIEREEVRALMNDTRTFLRGVPEATTATNAQLMEIMLAQDFQDLTGQVIKKITDVVYLIEQQLLGVLVENIALERREQFAANAAALAAETLADRQPRTSAERSADQSGRQNGRGAGPVASRRSAGEPRLLTLPRSAPALAEISQTETGMYSKPRARAWLAVCRHKPQAYYELKQRHGFPVSRQPPVGGTVRNPSAVRPQRCRMICIHAAGSHKVRTEQQLLGRSLAMWSRVRRAGYRYGACLALFAIAVQSAYAGLGGAPMTPPADASVSTRTVQPAAPAVRHAAAQGVMRSASNAALRPPPPLQPSYTVRETTLGNGTVVREYLAADGSVFGIAWHGPQMPDLNDLLGSYFPQYVAGVKAVRAARGGGHGPVAVDQSGLVVRSGGHMGAFSGQAWLPPALPAGVSGSDIQ